MSAVIFENVCKSFGDKAVLNDLTAVFEKNKKYCIMGESGIGKTTLLNLVLGIQKPDSGSVVVDGESVAVFQEDRLCEELSALANIVAVTGKSVEKREIVKMLSDLGLSGNENERVKNLSGGMKRRVALARCLLAESDVLVLDEPFKGLDDKTKETVAEVILANAFDKTLLVSTHDVRDAELLGADVLELK